MKWPAFHELTTTERERVMSGMGMAVVGALGAIGYFGWSLGGWVGVFLALCFLLFLVGGGMVLDTARGAGERLKQEASRTARVAIPGSAMPPDVPPVAPAPIAVPAAASCTAPYPFPTPIPVPAHITDPLLHHKEGQ